MDIDALKLQRSVIKGKLTRLYNYVNSFDVESNLHEIQVRNVEIGQVMQRFDEIQSQIEILDNGADREASHEAERDTFEDKYYSTKAKMATLLGDAEAAPPKAKLSVDLCNTIDATCIKPRVKLPQLELPRFDGDIKQWPAFKNIFYASVDCADLPLVNKLQYLKTALSGEAAGLISSLLITEDNYKKALEILSKRHTAVDVSSSTKDHERSKWQATDGNRLSTLPTGDRANLLRSHAAKSAECSNSSPRPRRAPRESRRVSLAQAPGYVQLNQYRLLEPIGQGSYGIVKLAYNEEDDTHYAMKILSKRKLMRRAGLFGRAPPRRPGPGPPPDPLQRIYREIAVLKKLDHPNVVKLVEVLDDPAEDQLYLVFQLLEGGPVIDIPTENPLSENIARRYFRDALLGVEYLHYQRIAHRDIKPANLLLGEDRVQVADLGACGELAGAGRLTGAVGTPAFRAPEAVATADKYNGEAADIWSLGITLFAMVTGRVPWIGPTSADLQRRVLDEPLTFPPRHPLSRQLKHLLARMLDKNPAMRATMQEIKEHEWITAGGKEPLPSEQENCRLVEVTEEDMAQVVTSIPNLSTLILIKTMLKKHSFQNPFLRSREGSTARRESGSGRGEPDRCAARRGQLARAGRSLSAPGNYLTDRQQSFDINLESVQESQQSQDTKENAEEHEKTQHSAR